MLTEQQKQELRAQYNPDGSELRNLQSNLLDVLLAFDTFCRQHQIEYSLAQGTLLGAVRHQGFIPWDDDMDLMVTRENYEKLRALLPCENLRLCYVTAVPGLTTGNMFIDLMIVDNVPNNPPMAWLKKRIASLVILLIKCRSTWDSGWWKTHLKPWHVLLPMAWILPLKKWQDFLHERVAKWGNQCHTTHVATYTDLPGDVGKDVPVAFYEDYIDIDFEGHFVRSIANTDAYLTRYYHDYMALPKHILTHGRTGHK